jgi:hypothetical protein
MPADRLHKIRIYMKILESYKDRPMTSQSRESCIHFSAYCVGGLETFGGAEADELLKKVDALGIDLGLHHPAETLPNGQA